MAFIWYTDIISLNNKCLFRRFEMCVKNEIDAMIKSLRLSLLPCSHYQYLPIPLTITTARAPTEDYLRGILPGPCFQQPRP